MTRQTLLLALAIAMAGTGFSQTSYFNQNISPGVGFANDINGRPMYLKTEYVADGSPYLYEEYCLADITMMNGKVYSNVKTKINLQEKLLLYMMDNGMEMIMTTPVKKIKFYSYVNNGIAYSERTFQSHLLPLNADQAPIYEVLAEDSTALLLKQTVITYTDSKGYGEATITRAFKRSDSYFAAVPSQSKELRKIERNKTAVTAMFGPKSTAVSSFIEKQKLRCKTDEELVAVFRYYATL